jgi:hypothetical protein
MLTNTRSWPSTKSHQIVDIYLALSPSFRLELFRILKIFLIIMSASRLNIHWSTLFNWDIWNVVIFHSHSRKNTSPRAVVSACLILYPVYVSKLLQIFSCNISVWFDNFIYLCSKLFLNIFSLGNIVNHHLGKSTWWLVARYEKCTKLFYKFIKVICISLFFFKI